MKRVAEAALALASRLPPLRSRRDGRVLILAYHNVTPPGLPQTGEHSAHIPWSTFLEHLDVIERVAKVISLGTLLTPLPHIDRPYVVLTFDDAYAGAMQHGIPEIARRGWPVTVFVPPGFLDGAAFWWDTMANPETGVLDQRLRGTVLDQLHGRTDLAHAWAMREGIPLSTMAEYAVGSSLATLRTCAGLPGVSFAGHTWSHGNLLRLSADELSRELRQFDEWARSTALPIVPAFAFPYGHWNAEIDACVRSAGQQLTVRVEGGWCDAPIDVRRPLPRLNIPAGLSAAGLEYRLRGIRS